MKEIKPLGCRILFYILVTFFILLLAIGIFLYKIKIQELFEILIDECLLVLLFLPIGTIKIKYDEKKIQISTLYSKKEILISDIIKVKRSSYPGVLSIIGKNKTIYLPVIFNAKEITLMLNQTKNINRNIEYLL